MMMYQLANCLNTNINKFNEKYLSRRLPLLLHIPPNIFLSFRAVADGSIVGLKALPPTPYDEKQPAGRYLEGLCFGIIVSPNCFPAASHSS